METIALKEWAVAVKAMEQGLQNVIFRKGGIQEAEGDFHLLHTEFLLYPAREHQKSQFLKPDFLPLLEQVQREQQGHKVVINNKARVLRSSAIQSLEEAHQYRNRHIWNDDFIQMRLDYKPDRPLYVIELAIEPLIEVLEFIENTEYAGCKSWVYLRDSDSHHS